MFATVGKGKVSYLCVEAFDVETQQFKEMFENALKEAVKGGGESVAQHLLDGFLPLKINAPDVVIENVVARVKTLVAHWTKGKRSSPSTASSPAKKAKADDQA